MNLREYLRLFRRYWVLVLVAGLLGVVGGSAATLLQAPEYESTAKSYVSTGTASSLSDLSQGNSFAQQAIKTYADVATTPFVLNGVIQRLGLDETAEQLAASVTVAAPVDETILTVTVTDRSANRAARIANGVAAELGEAAQSLTPDTTGRTSSVRITQLQAALPAASPASPSLRLNLLIGVLLAVIAGVVLAAIANAVDTRVRNSGDVRRISGLPLLASIAFDGVATRAPLVMRRRSGERMAEAYRTLRTNLQASSTSRGRAITITSAIPGEGKTTTSLNLAVALADAYESVLLVDADLRQPQVADRTGLDGSFGLTEVLTGRLMLDDALQHWSTGNLSVLTAGSRPANPSELLQSKAGVRLLEELTQRFDTVIIDSPPLLEVSDAAVLARRTEGALLVCGAGRVRRPQIRGALSALQQVGADVIGIVVTMERRRRSAPSAYQQYEGEVVEVPAAVDSDPALVR